MKTPRFRDDDGNWTYEGDKVTFTVGMPPLHVTGTVVNRNGTLTVLTPNFTPDSCPLRSLRRYVGGWWKEDA